MLRLKLRRNPPEGLYSYAEWHIAVDELVNLCGELGTRYDYMEYDPWAGDDGRYYRRLSSFEWVCRVCIAALSTHLVRPIAHEEET